MSYSVYITETSYTSVSFNTKEEAEEFIKEPDYDMCRAWELSDSKIELVEDKLLCLKQKLLGLMN